MSAGLSQPAQTTDSFLDPQAVQAWELYCTLLHAYEIACMMSDYERATNLWVVLQSTNADLMRYYQSLLAGIQQ